MTIDFYTPREDPFLSGEAGKCLSPKASIAARPLPRKSELLPKKHSHKIWDDAIWCEMAVVMGTGRALSVIRTLAVGWLGGGETGSLKLGRA